MNCECEQLPSIFNLESYPNYLLEHLELRDEKDGGWRKLYKCTSCDEYWQLDLIDRLQTNCAIKIGDPDGWQNFDDKPLRFQYLIDSRGGLSNGKCVMANCQNNTLKSLAHCPVHAYETLGLRE